MSPTITPARVVAPVGREQAGERRHEVHAAVVGHGARELLDLGRALDQAEVVAQPLHGAPVTAIEPSST